MISHERLKELLHYNTETGVLTWRGARQGVRVGDAAGWVSNFGYRRVMIDGGRYMAHRSGIHTFSPTVRESNYVVSQ